MGDLYRHELKFLINEAEHQSLLIRMKPYFKLDKHAINGDYTVRSLYFDDIWNSAYEERDMGIFGRKKYRIRLYDGKDDVINLERKKKQGTYIYKEAAGLTRFEVEKIRNGDYSFLLESNNPLLQQFYIECISNFMRERVIVDYDREPFILEEGTVRVTFDKNVRAVTLSEDLFDKSLPALEVLEPGKLIMEVKYTEFLPQIVKDIINPKSLERCAASKYCLCYDKTSYLHGYGYYQENYI